MFGHCVGSVSLQMAILGGLQGIRAAVCAQFPMHPASSVFNMVKSQLHTADVLGTLGVDGLAPDTRPSLRDEMLDIALRALPMPAEEQCSQAVCRWINAVFGCTHRHAQLNEATHRAINEMFGFGNIETMEHLALMLRKGRAVTHTGGMDYFDHPERMAGTRLLLLQGMQQLHLSSSRLVPDLAMASVAEPAGRLSAEGAPRICPSRRDCREQGRDRRVPVDRGVPRPAVACQPRRRGLSLIAASPSSSAVRIADAVSLRARSMSAASPRMDSTRP